MKPRSTAAPGRTHSTRVAVIHDDGVASGELLGTAGRLVIDHGSMTYELRETRQGKLLLTKKD